MVQTRIPASIDAIVTALQAAGLNVWDGPILTGDYTDSVYIGYDAQPDIVEQRAATSMQSWAGLGNRARNEDNGITCAVVTLTGDTANSWKAARDHAFSMLETVGQVLRADPSLGLSPPSVAELEPGDYFQEIGPAGYQCRIAFVIHHLTRV
jgi:hypothetical protein